MKGTDATLLTGGKRPAHLPEGYYLEPTVFTDVKPTNRLWRDEVFGPVLASATFKTEADAIAAANASEYGLAAAVISADMERCKRVAAAMETGIVWINCSQPCFTQVCVLSVWSCCPPSMPIRGVLDARDMPSAGAMGREEGLWHWAGAGDVWL